MSTDDQPGSFKGSHSSQPEQDGSGGHRPPPQVSGPLEVPSRSSLADFLAVAALGFLVFGPGFAWLVARSRPYETFSDVLWSTGVWSGLLFGVAVGLVSAFLLKPRPSSFTIESPEALRSRLERALSRTRHVIQQDAGNEILLRPARRPPLPILKEATVLLRISGNQVTIIGTRSIASRLKRSLTTP